ncbi:hypothetical protein HDF22_002908 [Mucilaginibacter lappiensis]|uniref:Uncharacterized protein n=1 Tax=Mucilaginibacter lappiensis TaxID=354630 RepID=A0A841JK62_9SPHI|nr:hypothetical protein [Mucilaginibacter lappiensis]
MKNTPCHFDKQRQTTHWGEEKSFTPDLSYHAEKISPRTSFEMTTSFVDIIYLLP